MFTTTLCVLKTICNTISTNNFVLKAWDKEVQISENALYIPGEYEVLTSSHTKYRWIKIKKLFKKKQPQIHRIPVFTAQQCYSTLIVEIKLCRID